MNARRTTISFEEAEAILEEHFAQMLEYNKRYNTFEQLTQINQSICMTILTLLALNKQIKSRDEKERQLNIEFVSYNGGYPSLCGGVLQLKVDGRVLKFGCWEDCDYPSFWMSGGGTTDGYDFDKGDWIIDEKRLPDFLKPYSDEISRLFNENVPKGCCGGCE